METATVAPEIPAYLERQRAALNDEIRCYPTPIARCDEQLTALLEARDETTRLLRTADDRRLIHEFIAAAGRWDDAEARRLRSATE